MKTSELKRLLKKAGCYQQSEGGSHEIWYSPISKRKFTVPRHNAQEMNTKTVEAIKKQAGLK